MYISKSVSMYVCRYVSIYVCMYEYGVWTKKGVIGEIGEICLTARFQSIYKIPFHDSWPSCFNTYVSYNADV